MTLIAKCLLVFAVTLMTASAFTVSSTSYHHRAAKNTQLQMTVLTYKGKKMDFAAGSPLSSACAKLGVKPKYSCRKGDCGSCTISVAGSRVKACTGKVPPEPRLASLKEKGLEIK